MKTAVPPLHFHLAEEIAANLNALRQQCTQQLRKPLLHTVHKLNRRLDRLLNEHTLLHRPKATRKMARYLVASLGNFFCQPTAASRPSFAKRKKRRLA